MAGCATKRAPVGACRLIGRGQRGVGPWLILPEFTDSVLLVDLFGHEVREVFRGADDMRWGITSGLHRKVSPIEMCRPQQDLHRQPLHRKWKRWQREMWCQRRPDKQVPAPNERGGNVRTIVQHFGSQRGVIDRIFRYLALLPSSQVQPR